MLIGLATGFLMIRGAFRGLSGEIVSLIGTVGGFYVAWKLSPQLGGVLSHLLGLPFLLSQIVAFLLVMLGIALLAALLDRTIKKILRLARLTALDRLLGVFSGILKATVLLMVVYAMGMTLNPLLPAKWMEKSQSIQIAEILWPHVERLCGKGQFSSWSLSQPQIKDGVER